MTFDRNVKSDVYEEYTAVIQAREQVSIEELMLT